MLINAVSAIPLISEDAAALARCYRAALELPLIEKMRVSNAIEIPQFKDIAP